MNLEKNKKEYIVFFVIVNFGLGSKVLKESKELGVSGGTIFLGKGTAKSHFLEILGLDEIKKEIVLMISEAESEDRIHEGLSEKFHLYKPNHGIAFSSPVRRFLGKRSCLDSGDKESGGRFNMEYEAIITIVDRGFAEEVVDAAVSAGAEGGTIINGRGSGIHENSMFFSMNLEPEKEIVMILIHKSKANDIVAAIRETIHLDEPGKGVMFTIDINKTSGLFNDNNSL